jgi:hypothetical protein
MTLSSKSHEKSSQYIGVLNGVWYRMDADAHSPGALFRLDPKDLPPSAKIPAISSTNRCSQSAHSKSNREIVSQAESCNFQADIIQTTTVDDLASEFSGNDVKRFYRDGAEPLRAGHPDLWNLLVAGTCLEGSEFQAG